MVIGDKFQGLSLDSSIYYHSKAKDLSIKLKNAVSEADAVRQMGWDNYLQGEYDKALAYYDEAIKLTQNGLQLKDLSLRNRAKKVMAAALGNSGGVYYAKADYPKAFDNYFKALKIAEEIGNKKLQISNLSNLGVAYDDQQDFKKALEYYSKSLRLLEQIDNKRAMSIALGNIGTAYYNLNDLKKALEYYEKALVINKQLENIGGIASNLGNIGSVYSQQHNFTKSLECNKEALKFNELLGAKEDVCVNLSSIGAENTILKNYEEAERNLKQSFAMAKEIGYVDMIKKGHENLAYLYEVTNKKDLAYYHYKKFISIRDSMLSEENLKASMQKEMQFNYDKKAVADSIKTSEEKKASVIKLEASEAKLGKERTQKYALFGGLALVLVFSYMIYNRFKITQKQKQVIELKEIETARQKDVIEEKQKEILDSINYAKRIQYTLLAHKDFLSEHIPDHFVYFNPKDIVSGDFYWAIKRGNKFYIAACDSTGHGVPGAFMSLLNISFLNEAIGEKGIEEPHEVLDFVRQRLIDNISKEGQRDGFDGILVCIDKDTKAITYAAANNAPIYISNNKITELPADRMPVGKGERDEKFSLHTVNYLKGDTLYLYTDGYADQFGGPKGKKFMYKKLNEKLLTISSEPLEKQSEILSSDFQKWKGDLEQIDDVCVIGIKL
jgi:serine phosphatase RsbU (regulator of sigma subunit)